MKNIILCSDGTGKSGGTGIDTNIFRLYKAIDVQNANQTIIYDDGIGSTGSRWLRTISGIFGFGIGRNIVRMYAFLVRNYEPGDQVYLFGFSRGAATVRALAGMIRRIGLIRRTSTKVSKGGRIDHVRLKIESYRALGRYKRQKWKSKKITEYRHKHCYSEVPIKMVGCWDTVSALGFPQDSSMILMGISRAIDWVTNFIIPHRYFDYQLDESVEYAYHALSIDETRRTFRPILWDETAETRPQNIEQVWFSGVHGNVGGGYPRTGLSAITLDWMMTKAHDHGLQFTEAEWDDIKNDKNICGKMYDPRSGVHLYYRFEQRHVKRLTENLLTGPIRIHSTVFERINVYKYAPILPNEFDIVGSDPEPLLRYKVGHESRNLKKQANRVLDARKWLYHVMMEAFALMLIVSWYMTATQYNPVEDSRTHKMLMALVPGMFENMVSFMTYQMPILGISVAGVFVLILIIRKVLHIWSDRIQLKINWWLLKDFSNMGLTR